MNITLDGQNLFGNEELKVQQESVERDLVERSVAGLDGVLSVDLGQRGKVVTQTGVLRAASRNELDNKIDAISAYMDGDTHTLKTNQGQTFDNLRMDVFNTTKHRASGNCVCCDYEIIYKQLRA